MEKQALHAGLEKIKEMFSDKDPVMDITKKLSVPLGTLALIGGGILAKRKLFPPKLTPGQIKGLVGKHEGPIMAEIKRLGGLHK